jgi:hypothetical protein
MQIHITQEHILYDGSQLASHFALKRFGVSGDSIVVFTGPMDVAREHMADLEDLLQDDCIRSSNVLHFIVELFGADLESAILKQRLLARLAADIVARETGKVLVVRGDDLFAGDRKLSVSIAAPSPVSCLIHLGLNIETKDVPVKAVGLRELNADPGRIGELLAEAFREEMASVSQARCKVRGVP